MFLYELVQVTYSIKFIVYSLELLIGTFHNICGGSGFELLTLNFSTFKLQPLDYLTKENQIIVYYYLYQFHSSNLN